MSRVLRAMDQNRVFRFYLANTGAMVETMRQIHHMSPTATAALGRLMTMAALMSLDLKTEKDRLTLKIRGDGPAGLMVAEARWGGKLRAMMDHPEADCPPKSPVKLDVGALVGRRGNVAVIRDYGLKEPYAGLSPLVSGEIAEDFAHYFYHSEQKPSVVSLGVLVERDRTVASAGGLWVQALPDATEEDLVRLEKAVENLPPISGLFREERSLIEMLRSLFPEFDPVFLDEIPVEFQCSCSREKVEKALISLGEDLEEMVREGKEEEVLCHFCHAHYRFRPDELKALLTQREKE